MQAGAACSYRQYKASLDTANRPLRPEIGLPPPEPVPAPDAVAYIVERDDAPVSSRLLPRVESTGGSSPLQPAMAFGLQLLKTQAKETHKPRFDTWGVDTRSVTRPAITRGRYLFGGPHRPIFRRNPRSEPPACIRRDGRATANCQVLHISTRSSRFAPLLIGIIAASRTTWDAEDLLQETTRKSGDRTRCFWWNRSRNRRAVGPRRCVSRDQLCA